MNKVQYLTVLVVGFAAMTGADTFYLTNSVTRQGFGPFQFQEGTSMDIGGQRLTIQKVLTDEQKLIERMKLHMIQEIEFREATASDVVDFLNREAGINDPTMEAILRFGPSSICLVDPPTATGPSRTNQLAALPTVTFTARFISLYDVINMVAAKLGLTWSVQGKVVVLQRKEAQPGGAPLPRTPQAGHSEGGH